MLQTIEPEEFGLNKLESNIKYAKEMLNDLKYPVKKYGNGDHTLWELPRSYILVDNSNEKLPRTVYVVEFQVNFVEIFNRNMLTQIKIWRNAANQYTDGLAKNIFFNHLLHNYKSIMTDSLQTKDGQRFWDIRIREAMQMKLNVYYINFESRMKIIHIQNPTQYQKIIDKHQLHQKGNLLRKKNILSNA